ncbi:MAG: hypothetical protein HC769_07935 [Cyanobacteria bacterium CRU_2_1]|nr:hypothetical protein [Cyanobacteria bacterium RU_5_0]NJR58780.1 hypothetical protein [Cyanobacteria bacterium CRU_2_1]
MKTIQETFLELDWEDEAQARQARDVRAIQLQEQGYVCSFTNLYTVSGYRVFLLEATKEDPIEGSPAPKSKELPNLRPKRLNTRPSSFQER